MPEQELKQRYKFSWKNNSKRLDMYGKICIIEAYGKMGSVLVKFWDGQKEIISRRALRKAKPCFVCDGDGFYPFPESSSMDNSDGYYECDNCDGTGYV